VRNCETLQKRGKGDSPTPKEASIRDNILTNGVSFLQTMQHYRKLYKLIGQVFLGLQSSDDSSTLEA